MKKILYLGNIFPLEASLGAELMNNPKWDILFMIDPKWHGECQGGVLKNLANIFPSKMGIGQKGIEDTIEEYKPDHIIVRCWTKFVKMPIKNFLYYKCESYAQPDRSSGMKLLPVPATARYILNESRDEIPVYQKTHNKPTLWLPYCVSPYWERPCKKTRNIVSCGTMSDKAKVQSFNTLVKPVAIAFPNKIDLYINRGLNMNSGHWAVKLVKPRFMAEQGPGIIGSAKIFISPTSFMHEKGAFSHKTIQAMGCRTATITKWYPSLEEYFGPSGENLVYAKTGAECLEKVRYYLNHDKERDALAERGYRFIHENYGWDKHLTRVINEVEHG